MSKPVVVIHSAQAGQRRGIAPDQACALQGIRQLSGPGRGARDLDWKIACNFACARWARLRLARRRAG